MGLKFQGGCSLGGAHKMLIYSDALIKILS